jgi:hypothetical protein
LLRVKNIPCSPIYQAIIPCFPQQHRHVPHELRTNGAYGYYRSVQAFVNSFYALENFFYGCKYSTYSRDTALSLNSILYDEHEAVVTLWLVSNTWQTYVWTVQKESRSIYRCHTGIFRNAPTFLRRKYLLRIIGFDRVALSCHWIS